ncbi:TPA: hypothetical protein DCR49_11500 [Candidatus Delongbacteria bacterium]|nr:MAG: hypothetical protein A2Y39_01435 [Candidatus Delongbacteria bacterium GWF2_40_14]HAQ62598.1 hypothetical protein [Candidatus Delongbacteria bacterium]
MKTKEEQIIFISKQAEFEGQLARLYELYENKFPEFNIWPFLVKEERKHEEWLKQIIPKIKDGTIYFFLEDLTLQAIVQAIGYINKEYELASIEGITLVRAISVAHGIEGSALDKNFFHYLDSQSPAIQEILDNLNQDTKKHRDKLLQAMNHPLSEEFWKI